LNNASTVSAARYLNGADAIQIRMYGNMGEIMRVTNYNNPSATARLRQPNPVDVNPVNGQNTSVGNLLLVWNPGTSEYKLAEITSVVEVATGGSGTGNDTKVNFSPGLSIYNDPSGLGADYTGGNAMMIDQSAMNTLTFFVDTNGVLRMTDGYFNLQNPADPLNVSALPLLDNVEDFQIQIGYDTSVTPDNIVDNWSWTYDPATNTPNLNRALVLRCYLLARSQRTERFVSNVARPDIDPDDGVTYAGAPDNVRRRMYSFTIQLRNRLIQRAKNVARNFDVITKDGTIIYGIIETKNPDETVKKLKKDFGVMKREYRINTEKNRIEIVPELAEEISRKTDLACFIVESYPTYEEIEVERIPLGRPED